MYDPDNVVTSGVQSSFSHGLSSSCSNLLKGSNSYLAEVEHQAVLLRLSTHCIGDVHSLFGSGV